MLSFYPQATFWTSKRRAPGCLGERGESDERAIWCLRLHRVPTKRDSRRSTGSPPAHAAATAPALAPACGHPHARQRWYPVIDRQRCSGLECLNFACSACMAWMRPGISSAARRLPRGCPACSESALKGRSCSTACRPGHRRDDKASPEARPVAALPARSVCQRQPNEPALAEASAQRDPSAATSRRPG